MRPVLALVLVTVAFAGAGCGSVARLTGAAQASPVAAASPPAASSPSPAATPTPAPTAATRLSISGAMTATVTGATAAGGCGRTPNGDGADLRFQVGGQPYSLSIELASYHGAGSYPLPPDRVSLHTMTIGPGAQFYGSQSGTVTVAAGDASGTVDATLAGNGGTVRVTGAWSCAG